MPDRHVKLWPISYASALAKGQGIDFPEAETNRQKALAVLEAIDKLNNT